MPKATVTLASGAVVNIEGTTAEVKDLLAFYGAAHADPQEKKKATPAPRTAGKSTAKAQTEEFSISEIVKHVKDCDEADEIESRILETTSQVNRILLPLFVVHVYMGASHRLTTGDISAVTKELGIPIHVANVSNALKGSAARYVIGDTVRRRGQPVRYLLSRRGLKYIQNVIKGKSDGE
ncbi:MAG: hypothetical protein NTV89_16040 [Proteobacteria bacterium]|nr:hypothetical protein [Pseudomonadota bacterium]